MPNQSLLRVAESAVREADAMPRVTKGGDERQAPTPVTPNPVPSLEAEAELLLASIVRSKVQPPPVRQQTLSRGRLLDWLSEPGGQRLRLIMAEAGYGKTTLLADFSRQTSVRCLWYQLDSSDGDWITFSNYLLAAVREVVPGFGVRTASLLRQMATMAPSRDIVLSSLLAELSAIPDEPTMLILDDFHVVDGSDDVQAIVERLVERTPANFSILISSRRPPNLHLGRTRAQGRVAELTTDDLRFSPEETEELFRSTYGHPLEPDLLREVEARTEGWGASLQLLHSSIRTRRPSEVRAFIGQMSGAEGSLYDFLAEEVLDHLDPDMQRFVTEASLLRTVLPAYAMALVSDRDPIPEIRNVINWLNTAEELGLLSRNSTSSSASRFHPLLHAYLLRRLEDETTTDARRAMHLRVARAADPGDWLSACHHYIEAEDSNNAMRLLAESAADVLGSGSWGPATELLPRIRDVPTPAAVVVLQARELIEHGRPQEALHRLGQLRGAEENATVRALIRQVTLIALWRAGEGASLREAVAELLNDDGAPTGSLEIAGAYAALLSAVDGQPLAVAASYLKKLAESQRAAGQSFFETISLYNGMLCELALGNYATAIRMGTDALASLGAAAQHYSVSSSIHAALATCYLELGSLKLAEDHATLARSGELADADAFADCAIAAVFLGRLDEATELIAESARRVAAGRADVGASDTHIVASAAVMAARGNTSGVRAMLEGKPDQWHDLLVPAVAAGLLAMSYFDDDPETGLAVVTKAIELARAQHSWRHEARLAVVNAALVDDPVGLRAAVAAAAKSGNLGLLQCADAIARSLHLLDPIPEIVRASIDKYPERWLPLIREQLGSANRARSTAACRVLSVVGTRVDVPVVRAFEATYLKHKSLGLGEYIAKRTSPILEIADLGRVELTIDDRTFRLSDMRRKAATLLMFLVTRAQGTATKEQVLEALWPDLSPDAASNSLHQTLYFVRRDIDPWFVDGESAAYIVFENELLWLDPQLITTRSWSFQRAAGIAMSGSGTLSNRLSAAHAYSGRFAPEFEYDDWSMLWRDGIHASYLRLVSSLINSLRAVRDDELVQLLLVVLSIEPNALELEAELISSYARLGATAAALHQYQRYSAHHLAELGEPSPSLDEVLRGPDS